MDGSPPKTAVLSEMVSEAFGDAPSELSTEFLREVRTNWREALTRARRTLTLIVLLSTLSVVLANADVTKITFGGVELSPAAIEFLTIALPAVIAFFFAQYWELGVLVERYDEIHDAVCHHLHQSLSPLDRALHPPDINQPSGMALALLGRTGWGRWAMFGTSIVSILILFLAPFAFVVASYLFLWVDKDPDPFTYFLSVLLASFFLVRALGFLAVKEAP